jgi:hypothetical protein
VEIVKVQNKKLNAVIAVPHIIAAEGKTSLFMVFNERRRW